jgi:hypothetical protein
MVIGRLTLLSPYVADATACPVLASRMADGEARELLCHDWRARRAETSANAARGASLLVTGVAMHTR